MTLFIVSVGVALSVSFLCSILEAALLSLSLTDIARMEKKTPRIAAIWLSFKKNISKPIAVILVVNTLSHTIGASVAGAQVEKLWGSDYLALFAIAFSVFMIQFTEILPKGLGVRHNRAVAAVAGRPLKWLVWFFTPFLWLVQFLNRPFEGKHRAKEHDPAGDIAALAQFATVHQLMSKEEEQIVARSVTFSRKKVRDVMVRTQDIKVLSTAMRLADALIEAHIHHHTRFPLAEDGDRTRIVGYVNFKDIINALQINQRDPSLRGIARPIISVNTFDTLLELLKKMTTSYQHIALVRDKKGVLVGLVTMEDVIESLVGDINDEYDVLPEYCYPITADRYLCGGGVVIGKLHDDVHENLPDGTSRLSDWLKRVMKQRTPHPGDTIAHKDLHFIVRKVVRGRIHEVIIQLPPPSAKE